MDWHSFRKFDIHSKHVADRDRSVIGYIIAYLTFLPVIWHHNKVRKVDPDKLSPESRLWWLLWRKSRREVIES